MESTLSRLKSNYPEINFVASDDFSWEPASSTVYYRPDVPESNSFLLHEISHSILGHNTYKSDIELLKMERDAWEKAKSIAKEYEVTVSDDLIEDALDSYRDWLHARSTCPSCNATGMQVKNRQYRCLACNNEWRVNEARNCRLMRYEIKNTP
jgi:hypothetical protein